MITNSAGVVLSSKELGEFDRLVLVYTKDYGKIPVRLTGVRRPQAKLRAFSQPWIWAEFRLYLRPGARCAKGVGGALLSVFPGIRRSWPKTLKAFYLCELMDRLTPEHQPNSSKYELLVNALEALEKTPGELVPLAFGLRLLEFVGYHHSGTLASGLPGSPLWDRLHHEDLEELGSSPGYPPEASLYRKWLEDQVMEITSQEIQSSRFLTLEVAG